jgi:hypothetical protein
MRGSLGQRVILTAAALFLSALSPLLAEQSPGDREFAGLRTRVDLVRLFREKAPEPRGEWGSLEAVIRDAESLRTQRPGDEAVDAVWREVALLGADTLASTGKLPAALDRFELVAAAGTGTPEYTPANLGAGRCAEKLSETVASEDERLVFLRKARDRYRDGGDAASSERALNRVREILSAAGLKAFDAQLYEDAYAKLEEVERELGGLGESLPGQRLKFLKEQTGSIAVTAVTVSEPGTEIYGKAKVDLSAKGAGETRKSDAFFETIRWPYGEYEVSFRAAGAVTLKFPLSHRGQGSSLAVPTRIPPGMLFIPAGGGQPAFLIDRTEVSAKDYAAFDPGWKPVFRGDVNFPAHDITFDKAAAFARARGKKLPTRAQWQRAAFGDTGRPFPWGSESASGRCNIGTGKLAPVDAFADRGASPYGVLNMAGNVWEWLDDGFALGGSWAQSELESGGFSFLRDPRPDEARWNSMGAEDRRRFDKYKIFRGEDDDNYAEVGFRCVIPL